LKSRDSAWARALARSLSKTFVTPNLISTFSTVFCAAAGACLWETGRAAGWVRVACLLGAVAGMQLRLVCNLIDGMVAVEGGKGSKSGELWNDVPDRISDLLIFVPLGYALGALPMARELGWLAGVLAVLTAYVRVLGGALGLKQNFGGPMGKPQRMAVMTAACVAACFEPLLHWHGLVLYAALCVVAAGSALTMVLRLRRIARELEAR